jgi:AcrR family transcriptional regulator
MQDTTRRRRRDAELNRGSLLEAALEALLRDPSAGLDAVAATAGLSRRTVYGHFASRDELVGALADRAGEDLVTAVRQVRATAPPGQCPVTTLARLELAVWHGIEPYRLLGSLAARPEHRARVALHTGEVAQYRRELLEAGRAVGELTSTVETAAVARLLQAVPLAVFDAVLEGELEAPGAGGVVALSALAVAGADPATARQHVGAALAADADGDPEYPREEHQ